MSRRDLLRELLEARGADERLPLAQDLVRECELELGAKPGRSTEQRLLTAAQLAELPPPRYLLEDLLRAEGFNVLYGPSGAAKTFCALDWSLSIATGTPFHARTAEQGTVVYIAAEGAGGLSPRIETWRADRGLEGVEDFYVYPESVNFFAGEVGLITEAIDGLDRPPALIVADTMARCMVGGDENSARDVGLFIDRLDSLRTQYGAAVLVVHHTGKGGELERGSSALRGAADAMLALKPDGAGLKLTCEKAKDAAPFEPWNLHLETVGESCLIRLGAELGRLSTQETQILDAVSAGFGTDWTSTSRVREVADVPRSSLYRSLKALVHAGRLQERTVGGQRREYRLPPPESEPSQPSQTVSGDGRKPSHHVPIPKDGTWDGTVRQKRDRDPVPDDDEIARLIAVAEKADAEAAQLGLAAGER